MLTIGLYSSLKELATMLVLSRIMIAMLMAVVVQYVVGDQIRVVCVSDHELINDGSGEYDDNLCCVYGNCTCNSLDHALANLTSNVLINITTDVTLSTFIRRSDVQNVSIIGHNNPTVNCKTGGIHFTSCSTCIIQGITWDGCGSTAKAGLMLNDYSNVRIQNCSFQHSIGQIIVLLEVSGDVSINDCKFTLNKQAKSLIYIESGFEHSNITLCNSTFQDNKAVSIFLVKQKICLLGKVLFLNNTADNGTGIYMANRSTVVFGENSDVTFIYNSANTAGGAIFSRKHSSIFFNQSSKVNFSSNSAGKYGAAICSLEHSHVIFTGNSKVEFNSNVNKYHNGKLMGIIFIAQYVSVSFESNAATYFSNNTAYHGGVIFSTTYCHVSLKGNSSIVFSNNTGTYGGAVYLMRFSSMHFEGNSRTLFDNNIATSYGGGIFVRDNSNVYFGSTTVFNNNRALNSGGAISIYFSSSISLEQNSIIQFGNNSAAFGGAIYIWVSNLSFKGNSTTVFSNNAVSRDGGAIRAYENSSISFEGNSVVQFSDNTGEYGGAVYLIRFSNIYFEGNSTTVFNDNTASYCGGAIRAFDHSNICSEGKSSTVFNNNTASYYGGAICSFDNSNTCFKGNSTAMFNNNNASLYHGGAICTYDNSNVFFEGNTTILFNNNTALLYGGAISTYDNSDVSFEGNTTILFNNNAALHCGGAISNGHNSKIIFEGNFITQFNSNTAVCGGAIGSFYNSITSFKGNSTTVFSNNIAFGNGAVVYAESYSDIIFDDNSKIILINNKAANSTTVYSSEISKVMARGNSSVIFNDIPAKWCNNTCLPYTEHSDVVTVDGHGIVRCSYLGRFTCQMKKCYCSKFERDFNNDSEIIITGTVILSSAVSLTNLRNISIIGHNNPFVYCINSSQLNITKSRNVVIKGITWIGCGNKNQVLNDFMEMNLNILDNLYSSEQPIDPVIHLQFSTNVKIHNCIFWYSEGPAVLMSELSGEVNISHCNFLNSSHYRGHGAAIHYSSNNKTHDQCLFTIIDCNFTHNKFAKSLVYIVSTISEQNDKITICGLKFYRNHGVSIYIANEKVNLIGKNLFSNNMATDGSGIYITDNSTVTFSENSGVKFTENSADNKGSAIFLQDHSAILFDQNSKVTFKDNKAINGTIYSEASSNVIFKETCQVTFTSNSVKEHGAAIHSFDNSDVTFTGNATVNINNNNVCTGWQLGGTIFSENNGHISFEGNSVTLFNTNTAGLGAAILLIYKCSIEFKEMSRVTFNDNAANNGGAVALYNCTAIVGSLSYLTFNNNTASQCGGALHISHSSNISFTDHSVTLFTDNRAETYGGAVCCNITSSIKVEKSSAIDFENNTATFGENLYSNGNSFTDIRNANLKINNNTASWYYGGGDFINKINDIIVDANGTVRCNDHKEYYICQYKKCYCVNIEDIPNDVVVIITKNITLSSTLQLTKIYNISLIGYNASVHCNYDGGLKFISCNNVRITNLTWYKFTDNERNLSNNTTPQITFYNSSNITIDHCTFEQSVGQAVVLSEVSGDVNIKHCKFVNNKHPLRKHGAVIHYSSNYTEYSNRFIMSDCHFANNSDAASLIYLEKHCNYHNQCESIILQNSKFDNNQGICVYLSNQNLYIKGNVLFENNEAENSVGIFISDQSNVTFGKASNVLFVQNVATISGGAMYIYNWSSVVFEKNSHVMFISNKAMYGGAIYCKQNCDMTITENSTIEFLYNEAKKDGGCIFSDNESSITFKGNSITTFYNSKATQGGVMHSCNSSGIILDENSQVWFNHSTAELGGTLYIEKHSYIITKGTSVLKICNSAATNGGASYLMHSSNMTITGNSTITFLNNEAESNGGSIYSNLTSSIIFDENSKTKIHNNGATQGGGIYSYNNSYIILDKNSHVWFNHSIAKFGGTLYIEKHSYIITKGVSALMISNSEATNGGASYLIHSSHITFTENSTIMLLTSKAEEDGGGIYLNFNSSIMFKGNSIITITNNKATQGGAIYSTRGSNIDFDNNSTAIFNRNEATVNGGCIFTKQSHTQFRGTCRAIFNISVVFNGAGGAFCADNSSISFISGNVTFYKNAVYNGVGGAICCNKSIAIFEGTSDVRFDGNRATYGGAANFDLSSLIIRNNTVVTFSRNLATMSGAVNFNDNSNGTFEMNSTIVLRENSALQNGGAFYLASRCYIEFKGFVNVQFDNNNAIRGGAIFSIVSEIKFKNCSIVMFKNNAASQDGGAIYVSDESHLTFVEGSNVTFYHNRASDYGGAIYSEMGNGNITFADSSNVTFLNNSAETTGSSVYMSLPRFCNSTCLTESVMVITKSMKDLERFIFTSPNKIKLYNSRLQCIDFGSDTECGEYYIKNIMLGQKILLDACMYDYYNHSVDVARFSLSGTTDNQGYYLESNNILITCNRTLELASIYGNESTQLNYSITLSLYDNHQSEFKKVMIKLMVELSQCHPGFSYNKNSQKCECYNATEDIVFCSGSSSTIKRGYWFGNVTGKPTTAFCPINYCNFTCCDTSNGYYHLSPVRDNQCSSHRSGTACGTCMDPYTLSYDSTKCVNVESCTTGHTVLVVLLTVIYWIVMVTLVFGIMYYKVGIGYLYGITYYYSIVDILLSQNMYASRGLYLTVNIMSSFSKIIPQFLGELCVVTGLSGIDQQFIHYIHPSAVITILIIISLIARRSQRISVFISRGIIHVICLLLLLSYTSIASTSLLLMRQLKFDGIDEVYTYLSPDIKFFHDRHLVYGIVALLFMIFIVIGPPLLLTLEPFLNHKLNFTKIKPLLDQFQGCYKDKYRCFAGYYMVCRLVIITIVIADSSNNFVANYLLITTCGIIALIHLLVKPYNSGILNKLDGVILQLIIFTEALSLFDDYDSPLVVAFSFLLVILPLLMIIGVAIFLHKDDLQKRFRVRDKPRSKNELLMADYHLIVSNDMRENATTCDV